MCIGNLRSATQNFCDYISRKDWQNLRNTFLYFGIIGCFILGAILGNRAISYLGKHAILTSVILLCVSFIIMFIDREKERLQEE